MTNAEHNHAPTPMEPQSALLTGVSDSGKASHCPHDMIVSPSGAMGMCARCDRVATWRDGMWEWQEQDSLGRGPFIATDYVGLPGDRILHVATDPNTGIGCAGREDFETAKADARALNCAFWLGFMHGRDAAGTPDDAMYRLAVRWVVSRGHVITLGQLQRALALGFIQAEGYLHRMEADGIVKRGSVDGIWAAVVSEVPERLAYPAVAVNKAEVRA